MAEGSRLRVNRQRLAVQRAVHQRALQREGVQNRVMDMTKAQAQFLDTIESGLSKTAMTKRAMLVHPAHYREILRMMDAGHYRVVAVR